MIDYTAAIEALTAPKRLKTTLPIPYVLEKAGVEIHNEDGRLMAICPFHPDNAPSLYMVELEDTGWRWGCWSCGVSGDVIDLMRQLWDLGFTAAVAAGERAVVLLQAEGWEAPPPPRQREWDAPWARLTVRTALQQEEGVQQFVAAKRYPFPAIWLRTTFDVGSLNGELIVPCYTRERELVGVKHRRCDASDHLFAFPGSKINDTLYGEWHMVGQPVVLCEGESDTWAAAWTVGAHYDVLGLPTGAGTPPRPRQLDILTGRQVHLVFDGDDAGRVATSRWAEALAARGCDVRPWALPGGSDIASLGGISWTLNP